MILRHIFSCHSVLWSATISCPSPPHLLYAHSWGSWAGQCRVQVNIYSYLVTEEGAGEDGRGMFLVVFPPTALVLLTSVSKKDESESAAPNSQPDTQPPKTLSHSPSFCFSTSPLNRLTHPPPPPNCSWALFFWDLVGAGMHVNAHKVLRAGILMEVFCNTHTHETHTHTVPVWSM